MVHQKNKEEYLKKQFAHQIHRDVVKFLLDNAYIDRHMGEVINLKSHEEVLAMLRKKYPSLKFIDSKTGKVHN